MKKKIVLAIAVTLAIALVAVSQTAQPKPHRVVFHMMTNGNFAWDQVLRNINALQGVWGAKGVEIEVVCLGPGLEMLLKKDTRLQPQIEKASGSGVVFAACQNTMRAMHVTKDDLLDVSTTVDAGVAELTRKEEAGWSYIRSGGEFQVDPPSPR